jgi:hypothetical protein
MVQFTSRETHEHARRLPMEHRWGQRIDCGARVHVSTGTGGGGGAGRLRNVSMSGAFLESAIALPLFARITLAVLRDDAPLRHANEVVASIVRREADGFGIEWCETPASAICGILGCTTRCAAVTTPICADQTRT